MGPILLDNVKCQGVESTILDCLYDTRTYDCFHYQDASVVCVPCELNTIGYIGIYNIYYVLKYWRGYITAAACYEVL